MNILEPAGYEEVVRLVRDWPAEKRLRLIQDLARTLQSDEVLTPQPRDTLSKARGLLKTDHPPPSDEEVREWLEEARVEKYG